MNTILRDLFTRTILPRFRPIREDEVTVLDCGFGKGAWIDSLLSEHPDYEVSPSRHVGCIAVGVLQSFHYRHQDHLVVPIEKHD